MLVATPIGHLGDLSPRAVEALRDADIVAAEDTRSVRRLLSHAGVAAEGRLRAVHAHNERAEAARIVEAIRGGARVAYASDAGTPGISDPGEHLVRACVAAGLPVEVVPGPSALLAALVLSGLPTARFRFEGFLPRKGRARAERLAEIGAATVTTVVFESPRRLVATLRDLVEACGPERSVAVARELTKLFEEVRRGPLGELADAVDAAGEPRGEQVVVVGPASAAATEPDDETVEAAVAEALSAGRSARDAADEVAEALGVPRRRAYATAVRLRGEGAGGTAPAGR